MFIVYLLFIVGLVMIVKGGDVFIESAVVIAKKMGVSQVIIGATIVSIGTTLPEVAASVNASIKGHPQFALGNAIGSIDCNTGLILGILILLSNIVIDRKHFQVRGGFLVGFTALLYILSLSGHQIGRLDGLILFLVFLFYMWISIKEYRNGNATKKPEADADNRGMGKNIILLVVGAVLITGGANLLVENGVKIATVLGVPDYIISLSMVAFGTSLPELVTSIGAMLKNHHGLSVGNILGANIMNIGLATSFSAMINPINISQSMLSFDLVMTGLIVTIIVLFGLFHKGFKKYNGAIIFGIYIFYLLSIYLGTDHVKMVLMKLF